MCICRDCTSIVAGGLLALVAQSYSRPDPELADSGPLNSTLSGPSGEGMSELINWLLALIYWLFDYSLRMF